MWQRSGMDRFYRGRGPIDVFSPAYRRSYAEYQRLKSGPEYQACLLYTSDAADEA